MHHSNKASSISTSSAASASVHAHAHVYRSTTRDDYNCHDLRTKKLHKGQLHNEKMPSESFYRPFASYTMLMVTCWHSEFCVQSGIDFEGWQFEWTCLFNYLLQGHQLTLNLTLDLFVVKCINTWKSIHCSNWLTLGVLRMGVCLHDYGININ